VRKLNGPLLGRIAREEGTDPMDAQAINAVKELVATAGSYVVLLLAAAYLIKRFIDSGYELHLRPTRKR
jgi:hypothetical protein